MVETVKSAMRIAAISPFARKLGLAPGLTLADARARIPDLCVAEMDRIADADLLERIAEDCDRFTPSVVIDAPDGLLLDITGCDHLFGGEAELRRVFSERLRRAGFHVRTVIASAPDAARALARHGRIAIVPPGEEARAVRPLPIAALGLEEEHRIAISRAGLKTIGHLADRPSLPFAARFGEAMTLKLRRILGQAETPLSPRRPVPAIWAEQRFAEPVGRTEDVEASLAQLAEETGRRLAERREGGRIFEAAFFRTDGAISRIAVETGRPVREAKLILRLFREKLDALADPLDPGFGFDLIRLAVPATDLLAAGQTSLDGRLAEENEIADLVDRLAARFGRERVVRFCARDTHLPERAAKLVPAGEDLPVTGWRVLQPEEPPGRPFHLFDPPQLVAASMAEVPDGPPRKFVWRRKEHQVRLAEGPERIAAEWWRTPGEPARDYYRIEDADGRRFWLYRTGEYREHEKPRWYLHGLFA